MPYSLEKNELNRLRELARRQVPLEFVVREVYSMHGHMEKPPLPNPTFDGYEFPKPESFFRPEWKKAAGKTFSEHPDSFKVGVLGWGLFERSWNLRGFENILMDAIAEPDFFEEVLDRLMNLYLSFVEYTADLPIDAILFGDDWGDQRGVIIGPERWRRFLKPRWAKIYEAVHSHGKIVMSHSCGSVADIIPDLIEAAGTFSPRLSRCSPRPRH